MGGPVQRVEAVVLGSVDYGERDRIVRLLTPTLGRLSALARGARGSRRRFGGALDLCAHVEVALRPGGGELWHLDEATLLDYRLRLRDDLLRMALATYGAELVGGLAQEHRPEPRLFGLMEVFLTVLDGATEAPRSAFRAGLEVKALTTAGVGPVLTRCARCGGTVAGPVRFDPGTGGVVHGGCGSGEDVDAAFVEALEAARRTRLVDLLDQDLPPGPPWLLARFAEYHLGRGLRSRGWLAGLEGTGSGGAGP